MNVKLIMDGNYVVGATIDCSVGEFLVIHQSLNTQLLEHKKRITDEGDSNKLVRDIRHLEKMIAKMGSE